MSGVEDKHGRSIHEGDEVELVYGGDSHRGTVTAVRPRDELAHRVASVEVAITVEAHAASVERTHRETPAREAHRRSAEERGAAKPGTAKPASGR